MESAPTSDQIDLMSNLPEDLLLDIMRLSSMKARSAVQTCMILSKRWKHLWEFLPDLDFDLGEFNTGDPKQDKHRFSCFVTTMLERCKINTLDKFRLSCTNLCKEKYCSSIRKWILFATTHKVRVLELAVCMCSVRTVLTDNVFVCDSIEELHLHSSDCNIFDRVIATKKINLPRLRKLQLHGQRLSSRDLITKLISGCPLLEELWLESFEIPYVFTICSQKLQHLTLKNCLMTSALTIKAPNIVSFCYFGSILALRPLVNQCGSISSLTISGVSLASYDLSSLKRSLINLSRLENLELCVSKATPNPESFSYYRTIYNLKKLSFCGHSLDFFPCIWKHLPNLEKLTLWPSCQHSNEHYPESLKWDDMLRRALIECKRLKVVEVVFATYDDHKRKMVDDLRRLRDVEIAISSRGI